MKKQFLTVAVAALALAGCSKNETVEVADSRAIGFNGSGVTNITRAEDITSTNFAQFKVYGGYNETDLFKGTFVNKNGETWSYNPTQYWVAEQDYKFGAYAPEADGIKATWDYTTGLTLTVNSDAANQNDLIYAAGTATTKGVDLSKDPTNPVPLNFQHMLSKIVFKFTKDQASLGALTVKLTNFTIKQLITDGTWTAGTLATGTTKGNYTSFAKATEVKETFGATTDQFYVIPQNVQAFEITVSAEARDAAGTLIKAGTISAKVPTTRITAWAAQNAYLYVAEIKMENIVDPSTPDAKPIVFEGSSANWDNIINGQITDITKK